MFTFEPTKHLSPQYNLSLAERIGVAPALVYAVLVRHFEILGPTAENNGGWFYHEQKWIMKYTKYSSIQTIKRAIKILRDCGMIQIRRVGEPSGNGARNYYFISDSCEWSIPDKSQDTQSDKMSPPQSDKMSPKEYLIEKNKNNINTSAEISPTRKRMSIIGARRAPTDIEKRRVNISPPKECIELATQTIQSILKNHPKAFLPDLIQRKINEGASTISKLVRKGYKFEDIESTFKWALTDSFWSDKFRSINGLDKIKTNGNIKFQNMLNSYESANKDSYDTIMIPIKTYIEQTYDKDEISEIIDDIEWFWSEIDDLNSHQSEYKQMNWMYDHRFIKVAKWVIDLDEVAIKHNFKELMEPYLEFIKHRMQRNRPDKLYPNLFSDTSELFREFINDMSYRLECKILTTQED